MIFRPPYDGAKDYFYITDVDDRDYIVAKKDAFGNSNCYYCLGLMDYEKSEGECPMNITWNKHHPIPGFILEKAQAI